MRQESLVVRRQALPIHAVHLGLVEPAFLLTAYVLEHIVALFGQVHFHFRLEVDGLQGFGGDFHLLHRATTQDEDILAVGIGCHIGPTGVHLVQEFGLVLAQVDLPHIIAILDGREVIKFLAILGNKGRGKFG